MYASEWKTVLLDYDRSTEFSGDDADRFSALCDLEDNYEFLTAFIPALDASAQISPYIQRDEAIASVPVAVHHFHDIDADGTVAQSTASGAGGIVVTFNIGGARYFRLHASANQAANRTFYCRGFNRVSFGG